jgi:hypothetical protein
MTGNLASIAAAWAPAVITAVSGVLIWVKVSGLEAKQEEIIEDLEELKANVTTEALADAILLATTSEKKDKKDKKGKKDKKDKKGKDKKKDKKK